MPLLLVWRLRALAFQRDAYALLLAVFDRRVPLAPKLVTAATLLYTLSPADLLPDVVPLLGLADDLGVVALGVALARSRIPESVFERHRATAARRVRSLRLLALLLVGAFVLWLVTLVGLGWLLLG